MTPSTRGLAEEVIDPGEAAVTSAFIAFLEAASQRRHPEGPIRRFNQGRAAGCVNAEFIVPADLPAALRVGLFAKPGSYRAYIRFANASSATDREKDVRGMSISIADVPGENLTPGSTSQDFVLNSHPVMVAPDTRSFMAFLEANEAGGLRRILYFARHPAVARIGLAARGNPSCHLDIPYLEHDALSVRYRPGGEGRRQARVGPHQPDAFAAQRQLPRRRAQTAPRHRGGPLRVPPAVPDGRGSHADRRCDGRMERRRFPVRRRGEHPHSSPADRCARHRLVRGCRIQSLAQPGRASSARQPQPGAPGDLSGAQRVPAPAGVKPSAEVAS